MLGIFVETLVPVFLVVGTGFVIARTIGARPDTLATLAYWVMGPVFVFDILSTATIDAGDVARVVGATAITMGIVAAAAVGAGIVTGTSRSITSASILTSIYGNVGNFGLAITVFALGNRALPIAGLVLVTVNALGILIGVGLATSRTDPWWKAAVRAITTPLVLAVVPALLVNNLGIDIPVWVDRPVGLVAAAFIPVMLLTLGIQLAGMRRVMPSAATAAPIVLKLAVAPMAAVAAITLVDLSGLAGDVVILQAAMPAAVFTSLVALEHDLEADFVTSVVLLGTLASVLTIPVVISLL